MKNSTKEVIILIPLYKKYLDDFEIKSLESINKNLKKYNIAFITPKSLDLDFLKKYDIHFDYKIQTFENQYFKSIEGYNKLLLSSDFYKTFLEYEYILICQTDAYIFKDELNYWLSKKYEYIGAPWLDSKNLYIKHKIRKFYNNIKKYIGIKYRLYNHINQVGNGGFSLRNTKKFYEISLNESEQISYFLKNKEKENYHIEDVFWSLYVPKKYTLIKPDYKTALKFCIDRKPEIAFKINNNKLPFACHGFNKKGVKKFWSKIIL